MKDSLTNKNPSKVQPLPQLATAQAVGSKFFNKGPVKPIPQQMMPVNSMIKNTNSVQSYGQKFDEYYGEEYDDEEDYGDDAP
jgi:hypothetical protein